MPREIGTAIIKAIKEDTTVPYMNGKAPNIFVAGFHSLPIKKPRPNSLMVGIEYAVIITIIATKINTIIAAKISKMLRKIVSPIVPVFAKEFILLLT